MRSTRRVMKGPGRRPHTTRPYRPVSSLVPALIEDPHHRCGREGLRVPEVGDRAPAQSRPSREALENDPCDVQGSPPEVIHMGVISGTWTCCSAPASALVQPLNAEPDAVNVRFHPHSPTDFAVGKALFSNAYRDSLAC